MIKSYWKATNAWAKMTSCHVAVVRTIGSKPSRALRRVAWQFGAHRTVGVNTELTDSRVYYFAFRSKFAHALFNLYALDEQRLINEADEQFASKLPLLILTAMAGFALGLSSIV